MTSGTNYVRNDHDMNLVVVGLNYGLTQARIANKIGISVPTLTRHYQKEIAAADIGRGRRQFEPTDEQRNMVLKMAMQGGRYADIAAVIGISRGTLRKCFDNELQRGRAWVNLRVASTLLRIALASPPVNGTVAACIFWMKTRCRWRTTGSIQDTPDEASALHSQLVVYHTAAEPTGEPQHQEVPEPVNQPDDAWDLSEEHLARLETVVTGENPALHPGPFAAAACGPARLLLP